MEISKKTIHGLVPLQNENIIDDSTFTSLLELAVLQLRNKADGKHISQLYGSKPDVIKNTYASLLTYLTCASKLDYDAEKFTATLTAASISGSRLIKLCDAYISHKEALRDSLKAIGSSLPHIVDINWRLEHCVKSNQASAVGSPLYTIELTMIQQGNLSKKTFTCTMQQLQELLYKLKDAARHVEKIASS